MDEYTKSGKTMLRDEAYKIDHGKGSWSSSNDKNMKHNNLMKADGASVGGFSSTKSSCSLDSPR